MLRIAGNRLEDLLVTWFLRQTSLKKKKKKKNAKVEDFLAVDGCLVDGLCQTLHSFYCSS